MPLKKILWRRKMPQKNAKTKFGGRCVTNPYVDLWIRYPLRKEKIELVESHQTKQYVKYRLVRTNSINRRTLSQKKIAEIIPSRQHVCVLSWSYNLVHGNDFLCNATINSKGRMEGVNWDDCNSDQWKGFLAICQDVAICWRSSLNKNVGCLRCTCLHLSVSQAFSSTKFVHFFASCVGMNVPR